MNRYGQTVCLNMIVKNEAPVIARCLTSVRPLIDSWVIVDTGSTDGTQEIVRELLADLPGELIERPWRDFGSNRTEALQLARGRADYVFVIDADEVVELDADFRLPRLTADVYIVTIALDRWTYPRRQLVRDALPWRYEGVLHEYIVCEQARSEAELKGIRTISYQDGSRSRDPNTYRRDALCLEEALIDDPDNSRYVFYLAQSYRDAGDPESALRHYRRRAEMPGSREETWCALYQIALVKEALEHPWPEVLEAYLEAFELVPDRAEPLFRIGLRYQHRGQHALAHTFLARAMQIPPPGADRLYVERALYDYLLGIEYALAAFHVGDHAAAVATNNELLRNGRLPAGAVSQVVVNRRFSLDARHQRDPGATVGRVLVVTTVRDPGPELEGTIAALLEQDDEDFQVVVVDEGSAVAVASRLPEDPRLRVVCLDAPRPPAAVLAEHVLGECAPDDVVVPLPPGHALAEPRALAAVRRAFEDVGCALLYAPHTGPNGELGAAQPAASAAEHDERGPALAAELDALLPRVPPRGGGRRRRDGTRPGRAVARGRVRAYSLSRRRDNRSATPDAAPPAGGRRGRGQRDERRASARDQLPHGHARPPRPGQARDPLLRRPDPFRARADHRLGGRARLPHGARAVHRSAGDRARARRTRRTGSDPRPSAQHDPGRSGRPDRLPMG